MAADSIESNCNQFDKTPDLLINETNFDDFYNGNEGQKHQRDDKKKKSTPSFLIHIKKTYVEEIDVIAMNNDDSGHFRSNDHRFRSKTSSSRRPESDSSYQYEEDVVSRVPEPEGDLIVIQEVDNDDDCIVPSTTQTDSKLTFVFPKRSLFDMMNVSEPNSRHQIPIVVPQNQTKRPKLALTWPESEITFEMPSSSSTNESDKLMNLVQKTLVEYSGTFPDLNEQESVTDSISDVPQVKLTTQSDGIGCKADREGTVTVSAVEDNQEVPNLAVHHHLLTEDRIGEEEFYKEKVGHEKETTTTMVSNITKKKKKLTEEVCIGDMSPDRRKVVPIRIGLSRKQPVQPLHLTVRKQEF